jgi:osmotically-inducible protein OsmY
MRHRSTRFGLLALGTGMLAGLLALAGCHNGHPDDKMAVYNALNSHDLASVEVYQDRDGGVITLRGIVGSAESKARAVSIAQQAAPGYTIRDQMRVEAAGLQNLEQKAQQNVELDKKIETNFKQSLTSDKRLRRQHIKYSALNGTLYLQGSVKSDRDWREAGELAKKVPDVKGVVNHLAVKPS